jgi:hypothetical protein
LIAYQADILTALVNSNQQLAPGGKAALAAAYARPMAGSGTSRERKSNTINEQAIVM